MFLFLIAIDPHSPWSLTLLSNLCQCLIETHDNVAVKSYEMSPTPGSSRVSLSSSLVPPDAVRMIGIQKRAGEPLVSLPAKPQLCSVWDHALETSINL